MKLNRKFSQILFAAVAVTLLAATSHADDTGVCVQIVEHTESEMNAQAIADTTVTVAPNKQDAKAAQKKSHKKSKTKKSRENEKYESLKNGATPTDSPTNSSKTEQTDAPGQLDVAGQVDDSESADKTQRVPPSLIPEDKVSAVDKKPKKPSPPSVYDEERKLKKELAAARSSLDMIDADMVFDPTVDNLPYGQTALVYLKRLFEHFVTHEQGYASVNSSCRQTITIELYPLKRGWTAFARYSGTNREERVDQLFATELSQFAERAVLALLHDKPISATIKRDNVLSSDSKKQVQQVKGTNHFTVNLGSKLVGAWVDQVQTSGDNAGGVKEELQIFHPMKFGLGYRGRFENWGLEVQAGLGIGVGKKASASNPEGGHIDYGGDTGLAIHFLHYKEPRGLMSFYLGGGAGFDFTWLSVINPTASSDTRSYLYTGGLSADGIFGWEFLRAASVQFYLQGELNLPLYLSRSEKGVGSINSWMPGISFKLGVVF